MQACCRGAGGGAVARRQQCEHAWRRQRKENDWAGFAPNLEEVVRLSREVATLRPTRSGAPL